MSNGSKELYDLLNDSCEDMLLYFQEVTYHLARDGKDLEKKLDALFTEVGLTTADQHQEGKDVSTEVKRKLAEWKQQAKATPEYAEFSQKYGAETAEKLLGMSGKFNGNPAGIGADDYPKIVKQVYEGNSTLKRDLKVKYSKVDAVVEYINSTCSSKQGRDKFSDASYEVVNSDSDFHLQQSALLAKFASFLTEKDKIEGGHSSYYNVMEYQFSMVFTQFLVFAPDAVDETQSLIQDQTESHGPAAAQPSIERKPIREKERVATEFQDIDRGFKNLVAEKREALEIISDLKDYKKAMLELGSLLAALIVENKKILEEMDAPGSGQNFKVRNEKALELAILEGEKSFKKIVDNEYRTVKVADVIGCNPAKMTVLERLDAVDKVESLKNEHIGRLINESITAMQKITQKPKSADHFAAASEGIAILEGSDTYQRSPDKLSADGSVSTIPKEDSTDCLEKRLEQFHCHYKENKKFLSDNRITKLVNFIENIKSFVNDFGKKLKQPTSPEITNSDNAQQNQSPSSQLKKRRLSETKISDILSNTLFAQKRTKVDGVEGVTPLISSIAPIVPRMPGGAAPAA